MLSSLSPSQRRRLERERRDLETHIDTLSNIISDLALETRADERIRLHATIEDKKEVLAEFENQLDNIES